MMPIIYYKYDRKKSKYNEIRKVERQIENVYITFLGEYVLHYTKCAGYLWWDFPQPKR